MPLLIVRNDITKMKVDAIVNAAKETLLGGGGVDGCIHRAAGPSLLEECKKLGGCQTGNAKVTAAGNLNCQYIIHTVGPQWTGGNNKEEELLTSCYKTSLNIAKEKNCNSVAFPLISSGIYGYPKDQALKIAVNTISDFLFENDMTVYIVIFDKKSYEIGAKLFNEIEEYIDDNYIDKYEDTIYYKNQRIPSLNDLKSNTSFHTTFEKQLISEYEPSKSADSKELENALKNIDESFSEMLKRKIDEAGISDSECYKKANIDRKLFSKIKNNRLYKPSKSTAIAFAIALELPLEETNDLLMKSGFALSHSNKSDIIIEYYIKNKNYNIFEINEALFAFDQKLLGSF